jgi:hypothetical protein
MGRIVMPKLTDAQKKHQTLVDHCGGTLLHKEVAPLVLAFPMKEAGNVGVALRIAAIRSHYRTA